MLDKPVPFRLMIRTGTVAAMSVRFHAADLREAEAKAARIVHRLHVDRGSYVEITDPEGFKVARLDLGAVPAL